MSESHTYTSEHQANIDSEVCIWKKKLTTTKTTKLTERYFSWHKKKKATEKRWETFLEWIFRARYYEGFSFQFSFSLFSSLQLLFSTAYFQTFFSFFFYMSGWFTKYHTNAISMLAVVLLVFYWCFCQMLLLFVVCVCFVIILLLFICVHIFPPTTSNHRQNWTNETFRCWVRLCVCAYMPWQCYLVDIL